MSHEMLLRGVVTDAFVDLLQNDTTLEDRNILVGDGVVPDDAGWLGPQRGKGIYVASVKVATGTAQNRDRDALASRHSSWSSRYTLRVLGGTRSQADNAADLVRAACTAFRNTQLACGSEGSTYKVTEVYFSSLGGVVPDLSEDPPLWAVEEGVEVWLDRDRT